ncbi:hypothetical protein DFH08DRAFT_872992 [Mycena albidolilacea]|uniref:Uncharacterized protein n=1 Tax=Mycena albidolilacea TaxID=1033008 RepID=A0AAD6ZYH3_9AGAR|nr:hypothetical protein DFH08DRAFT_872992 [Mycena albidolilacea]
MLPASLTKHEKLLACPIADSVFSLAQSQDGISNGTGLWLGAQCLSAYLTYSGVVKPGTHAVELGSGIGLTALSLARLGCNVTATDLPWVISSCLAKNVENNLSRLPPGSGKINVRELDWTVTPDQWVWDHETIIASPTCSPSALELQQLTNGLDLIVTADTIYLSDLVTPFLRTLHTLCTLSLAASSSPRAPVVFICLERRDPEVTDRTLEEAKTTWGFVVKRIAQHKVSKALGKSGFKWNKDDWEGVEIWHLTFRG